MQFQQRLFGYLRDREVPFTIQYLDESPSGVIGALVNVNHTSPLVRVVFAFVGRQLAMLVIPAEYEVDPLLLRVSLGQTDASLVDTEWLAAGFPDVDIDAIPPLGELWQVPIFVDTSLAGAHEIRFYGGSHDDLVTLRRADFERLTRPIALTFAVRRATDVPMLSRGEVPAALERVPA
jgi:Ala-tRNA(Pro) deacylase